MTLIDVVLPCLRGLSYIVYFKVYHVCFGSDTQDQSTLKLFCTDVIASCVVGFVFALTMVVGLNGKEQEICRRLLRKWNNVGGSEWQKRN